MLAGLTACSDEVVGSDAPTATCSLPSSIATPADIPSDFPWPDDVVLTEAQIKKQFVSMEGFSERSVEELFDDARPEITENGLDIINSDFEGFEAELYFAKGSSLAGIVSLREGPCDGHVKVNVIYDPLETAAGREAVRETRKRSGEG